MVSFSWIGLELGARWLLEQMCVEFNGGLCAAEKEKWQRPCTSCREMVQLLVLRGFTLNPKRSLACLLRV